jgi:hypothetical protein
MNIVYISEVEDSRDILCLFTWSFTAGDHRSHVLRDTATRSGRIHSIEGQMCLFVTFLHSLVSTSRPVHAFGANFSTAVWLTRESSAEFSFYECSNIYYVVQELGIQDLECIGGK